jgi:hypothetical protein
MNAKDAKDAKDAKGAKKASTLRYVSRRLNGSVRCEGFPFAFFRLLRVFALDCRL